MADKSKDKIEQAAKKLFAIRGYDSVTTREIADDAGVSLSSLSYHFKTKELLLRHLIRQFMDTHTHAEVSSLANVESLSEFQVRIEIFIETQVVILFKDVHLFRLFHNEMERRNPIVIEFTEDPKRTLLPPLINFFKQAQRKKILASDVDAQMAALMIFTEIIVGVLTDDLGNPFIPGSLRKEEIRKKWIKNLLRIVLGGIQSLNKGSEEAESRKS